MGLIQYNSQRIPPKCITATNNWQVYHLQVDRINENILKIISHSNVEAEASCSSLD